MKKFNLKKVFTMLLCLAMVFALGACGKSDTASTGDEDSAQLIGVEDDENTAGTASSGDGTTVSTNSVVSGSTEDYGGSKIESKVEFNSSDPFANIPKRLKGTTVRFASWGDETGEAYKKVIKAFTEKTGIKVEIVEYTQSVYAQTLATQVVNKNAPDIVRTSKLPAMLQVLQPLQNIFDLDDTFWDQQIIEYGTYYGNSYIINSWEGPWQGIEAVYYNKDLFEDNGLKTPLEYYKEGKWTYETLIECAKSVKGLVKSTYLPKTYVFNGQLGIETFSLENIGGVHKYVSNITKAAPALQFTTGLIEQKLYDSAYGFGSLATGDVAMVEEDLYGAKVNGYFSNMKDSSLAMVPLPSSYQGKAMNRAVGNTSSYGICKGAKNPEGAAYFLRWFLEYDNYENANADIFKNDSLKDMYFNEIVPIYKNNKNRKLFAIGDILWDMNGYKYEQLIDRAVYAAGSTNIQTVLDGEKNKFDDCAKKANAILDALK